MQDATIMTATNINVQSSKWPTTAILKIVISTYFIFHNAILMKFCML